MIFYFQEVNTYLHILPKLIKEGFLTLLVNVYFLSVIDKIIIFVCGEFFSLEEQKVTFKVLRNVSEMPKSEAH